MNHRPLRLALLLASCAVVVLAARCALARETIAPQERTPPPDLPLMCQIVRPPAHGAPDARLPVCAVPYDADDGRY